jgi:hypothetical protein
MPAPGVSAQQVRDRVAAQHDAGMNHPEDRRLVQRGVARKLVVTADGSHGMRGGHIDAPLQRSAAGLTVSARTDIARRAHDALNHGDTEAPAILCVADFRLDMSDRVFNPAVYSGHDGIRRFLAEVHEVWETFTWEPTDVKEAGDVVLALVHSLGRGARAGWRSIATAPCCDRSQTKRCSR